jgi:catechol-2,3-dioxygenase
MEIAALGHVILRVRDLERAETFYHGVLAHSLYVAIQTATASSSTSTRGRTGARTRR